MSLVMYHLDFGVTALSCSSHTSSACLHFLLQGQVSVGASPKSSLTKPLETMTTAVRMFKFSQELTRGQLLQAVKCSFPV